MKWTAYMKECLEVLSQNSECPYDQMFAHQVRLQRTSGELEVIKGTSMAPSSFYLSALRHKIEETKTQIPLQLQQDGGSPWVKTKSH